MTKQEELLALIAETLILIFANQAGQAGKMKEFSGIILSLKEKLIETMGLNKDI